MLIMDAWVQFFTNALRKNGAMDSDALLAYCTGSAAPSNCPKDLKNASVKDVEKLVQSKPESFTINRSKICLKQPETNFHKLLVLSMKNLGYVRFSELLEESFLKKCDKLTMIYIKQGESWAQGITNFLFRNDDSFVLWNEIVYSLSADKRGDFSDYEAISYFIKFLEKEAMSCSQLSEHWNNAPAAVKSIVPSANPEMVRKFLNRNSFFFDVTADGYVSKRSFPEIDLSICNQSVSEVVDYFRKKVAMKGSCNTTHLAGHLSQKTPETAIVIGTIGAKKSPEAVREFLLQHPSVFTVANDDIVTLIERPIGKSLFLESISSPIGEAPQAFAKTAVATRSFQALGSNDGDIVTNGKQEKYIKTALSDLLGVTFLSSLERLCLTLNIPDLSRVELLWLDVGKHPCIKVLKDSETVKYSIYEVKDGLKIDTDYLKSILKHYTIVPVSSTVFGIKGTLHTIRLNEQGNCLIGITISLQTHIEVHAPVNAMNLQYKNIDDWLRFILYNPSTMTQNATYSYVRSMCHDLSQLNHVIIVDKDGKITGHDPILPASVGRARRINCCHFKTNSDALLESYAHNPDYIITNCLEPFNRDSLQTIKHISLLRGVHLIVVMNKYNAPLID